MDPEWIERIDARLAESERLQRQALEDTRQFTQEMLVRFDKALERSDQRWRASLEHVLEESERRWRATLDRYFASNGDAPA